MLNKSSMGMRGKYVSDPLSSFGEELSTDSDRAGGSEFY
jgi:hypothetical protein